METFKKFFPLSTSCSDNETFVKNMIIYVVAWVICALIFSLLGKIPLIGILFSIIGWVVSVYMFIGIVLGVLLYFNILK